MSDSNQQNGQKHSNQTDVCRDDTERIEELLNDDLEPFFPSTDYVQSSDETVKIEVSRANAHRLANCATITAHHILQKDPEHGQLAAREALALCQDVKRQMRESRYPDRGEKDAE